VNQDLTKRTHFNQTDLDRIDSFGEDSIEEEIYQTDEVVPLLNEDMSNQETPTPNISEDRPLSLNIIKVRDQLWMRKDNYAYFVKTNGEPCDKGSEKLAERSEIPSLGELYIGQAKAIRKITFIISLCQSRAKTAKT
jgi:hypothetical protein